MRVVLVVILLLSSVVWAENSAVSQTAVDELNQRLSAIKTLRANFVQTVVSEQGELMQQASGEMLVKRPRQLRWQTTEPYQHLVVTDGETLWIFDQDLEQLSKEPFSRDLDKAPALLLSGDTAVITAEFAVSKQADDDVFILEPLDSASLFQQMQLQFLGDQILSMTLVDSFAQRTVMQFSDIEVNQALSEEAFVFVPPPGIDIIDNE